MDEPLAQSLDQHEQRGHPEQRHRVGREHDRGSRVIAKIAGIELAAKATSVAASTSITIEERRRLHAALVPQQEPAAVEGRHHRDDPPKARTSRDRPDRPAAGADRASRTPAAIKNAAEQVDRPLGRVEQPPTRPR